MLAEFMTSKQLTNIEEIIGSKSLHKSISQKKKKDNFDY
jgi:hypothetical protein